MYTCVHTNILFWYQFNYVQIDWNYGALNHNINMHIPSHMDLKCLTIGFNIIFKLNGIHMDDSLFIGNSV